MPVHIIKEEDLISEESEALTEFIRQGLGREPVLGQTCTGIDGNKYRFVGSGWIQITFQK